MAHDFQNGETIYDVDGNAFVVDLAVNKAIRDVENTRVSYYLGRNMASCFSRENPRTLQNA